MNPTFTTLVNAIFRTARPLSLLAGVLLYGLGGGIATYLGEFINWPVYWTGQAVVTLLQLSSYFLREYFDRTAQPPFEQEARLNEEGQPIRVPRAVFIQIAATTLTISVVLVVLLVAQGALNPSALLILSLAYAITIVYAVPPFRLVHSGYGELALAILVANLFPAFSYLLQAGQFHRLLALLTFPLTFLYLASALARSLQHYMEDIRQNRHTMMTRLGWQRGMSIHNILVTAAYLLLAFSLMAGLPWRLVFPAFLSMPVGLFQIWQINNIANGGKPRWQVLALTAVSSLGFMAYFLNLALWTG